ncbi:FxSxx-COOH system tetratricopeptide repeat protein, partial [Actinoplanes sp. NPDC051470]|uniref:FxSxx-COOH system tetratricopeptide repeat protein n=1 Tax=Actinoplanes sp. NPDC051470 TaxID=3157224 RepID=UPI0034483A95
MGGRLAGPDFFISYAGSDRDWAEWIAVQLEGAGFSTKYQAADFRPGRDFVREMHEGLVSAERTIVVLSPAYLRSRFGEAEWRAVFAGDPTGEKGLLIPVRVQPCEPPGLLATRVYVDLVEASEVVARKKLLAAVDKERPRPSAAVFPGRKGARFPGAGPAVSNLPARIPVFTGRADLIGAVYEQLCTEGRSAAVHGLGGIGKTTLAVEYAYRFRSDYELVWWIDAAEPATVAAQLAQLGRRLGLPDAVDERDAVSGLFAELGGRDRWLLVYDNAEQPSSLAGLIPTAGTGHVLVTSRWPDWRAHAGTVQVQVWPRSDSIAYLLGRTTHTDEVLLGELAELVGDLPLAMEEAAAYLTMTGEDLGVYVGLVRERLREMFATAPDAGGEDQRRVATVWTLSLDQVHALEPMAEQLLTLLAFLGPQVPRDLPIANLDLLPDELGAAVADRLNYNRLLSAIGRYALVSLGPAEVGMHRLVQAVVQARIDQHAQASWVSTAVNVVRGVFPADSWEAARWSECERLLPHLLAACEHAERSRVHGEQAGWLLARASTYLRERGQYTQAEPLARRALAVTTTTLGADHLETASRHDELGRVLQVLGLLDEARTQYELALSIGLAALGPAHATIGAWRNNLGGVLQDLGRLDEARTQYELALSIGLAALGPDYPTIGAWHGNLGGVLQDLGRLDEARTQYKRALSIGLSALGPDHPDIGIRRGNLGSV